MKKGNKIISFALALALSIGSVATGIAPANAAAKAGGTKVFKPTVVNHAPAKKVDANSKLDLGLAGNPPSLDSDLATDVISFEVLCAAMEGLTRQEWSGRDNNSGKLINGPGAAEKWEVSPDGLKWTFYLRKMSWSDGKPVTAKDFEYAWLRLLNPNVACEYATFLYFIRGAEEYNLKKGSIKNVGIRALSTNKLEVTLKRPTPYFEKILSFGIMLPVRKDIVEKLGDKYGTASAVKSMVWCGPFTVESWKLDQNIVLKKNPKYWDAKNVPSKEVKINIASLESSTIVQMFKAKQFDTIGATKNYIAQFEQESKEGKVKYTTGKLWTVFYVMFNMKDKKNVFTNEKIRKAFGLSVDREALCRVIYKRNIPYYSLVPETLSSGNLDYRKYVKTEQVKEMLKKYPTKNEWKKLLIEGLKEQKMDPDPSKLEVTFLATGTTADDRGVQEFYQNQWESNLGVKVKIRVVSDSGQKIKEERAGDYQLTVTGWGPDYNDPLTFLDLFKSGNGNMRAEYSSKEADKLIDKIQLEQDTVKRTKLFLQLENKVIMEDAVISPIFCRDLKVVENNYLNGMGRFNIGAQRDYKYAYTSGK